MFPARPLLRALSTRAAASPIETLVLSFILVTLAYFHILHAVKHSDFLSPATHDLLPAVAELTAGDWISLGQSAHSPRADLVQIVTTLDEKAPSDFTLDGISSSLNHLASHLTSSQLLAFSAHCYAPRNGSPCFTASHTAARTHTLTLAFEPAPIHAPGPADAFVAALENGKTLAFDGVRYDVAGKPEKIMDMKSGKWIAYAVRSLVLRFWDLAKVFISPLAFF